MFTSKNNAIIYTSASLLGRFRVRGRAGFSSKDISELPSLFSSSSSRMAWLRASWFTNKIQQSQCPFTSYRNQFASKTDHHTTKWIKFFWSLYHKYANLKWNVMIKLIQELCIWSHLPIFLLLPNLYGWPGWKGLEMFWDTFKVLSSSSYAGNLVI